VTAPNTPYTPDLAGRDPLMSMRDTIPAITSLVAGWSAEQYERQYAPGKWTARHVLIHLAQTELALGARARMALSTPEFAAQSFDQDRWLARERGISGPEAANAFAALATMNVALYGSLTDGDRQTTFTHPEYGLLTVDWLIHQQAGHQVHHLKQLQTLPV
jgi:hypothetical protein